MASAKVTDLGAIATVDVADVLYIVDVSLGAAGSKKITYASLLAVILGDIRTLASFTAQANQPPSSAFATLDLRNSHPVLDFDDTTNESAVFAGILPRSYQGGGVTVTVIWAATSAVAGNCIWLAAFERDDDEGIDIDADSFAASQSGTGAAPGTNGQLQYTSISFTDGAQMDGLLVGEAYRLKIIRDGAAGGDTMAGDAELLSVRIEEV